MGHPRIGDIEASAGKTTQVNEKMHVGREMQRGRKVPLGNDITKQRAHAASFQLMMNEKIRSTRK